MCTEVGEAMKVLLNTNSKIVLWFDQRCSVYVFPVLLDGEVRYQIADHFSLGERTRYITIDNFDEAWRIFGEIKDLGWDSWSLNPSVKERRKFILSFFPNLSGVDLDWINCYMDRLIDENFEDKDIVEYCRLTKKVNFNLSEEVALAGMGAIRLRVEGRKQTKRP